MKWSLELPDLISPAPHLPSPPPNRVVVQRPGPPRRDHDLVRSDPGRRFCRRDGEEHFRRVPPQRDGMGTRFWQDRRWSFRAVSFRMSLFSDDEDSDSPPGSTASSPPLGQSAFGPAFRELLYPHALVLSFHRSSADFRSARTFGRHIIFFDAPYT